MNIESFIKIISKDKNDERLLLEVLSAIKSTKYGYVQITIHNSKVVKIDETEKIRLNGQRSKSKGGGS